jgi:hypothetical protein
MVHDLVHLCFFLAKVPPFCLGDLHYVSEENALYVSEENALYVSTLGLDALEASNSAEVGPSYLL